MNSYKTDLTYEIAKDIFYKSDFYDWSKDDNIEVFKDEEGYFSESKKERFFYELNFINNGKEYKLSPIIYLHGKCDEFAIALAKEMNYKVGVLYEVDEADGSFTHLIHAYCIKEDGNNIENIDIRGICPDYTQIVSDSEFEYSYDYSIYDIMDVEEAIAFFEENMEDCRKSGHYDSHNIEIETIIKMFRDKFIV